jgi:hypothetical protein
MSLRQARRLAPDALGVTAGAEADLDHHHPTAFDERHETHVGQLSQLQLQGFVHVTADLVSGPRKTE